MRRLGVVALLAMQAGCASYSGIIPTGNGAFMASKQAATGFPGLGTLKTDIIKDAADYCSSKGKELRIIKATETAPPFVLGNYPRAEIEFACTSG